MNNRIADLTKGAILPHLFRLAVPTIGSSFMQMTYNLTDLLWLGRVGEDAVAAVGAAGFYIWFGFSVLLITRIGAEIGVSQSLGRKETGTALQFIRHSLFWAIIITLVYAFGTWLFASELIHFFGIPSLSVNEQGATYLRIVSLGFIFTFVNPTFAGIYNGMGNSKAPFWYMTSGVILNLILDPVLIFGLWFFPEMGVKGAAWATFISQGLVFVIFVYRFVIVQEMIKLNLSHFRLNRQISKRIFKLGIPVASESALFAFFAMIIARMVAGYGSVAIAVQSIGGQIEAISWMTSSGFATALGSFTGQNFGANKWDRIKKGYILTMIIGTVLGLMVTALFLFMGKSIFSVFLDDPRAQKLGATYLFILAVSQLFMITEITTRGAFNGLGRTLPPSLIGILFTGLRLPAAWLVITYTSLELYGIWWTISLTSVLKGIVLPLWFINAMRNKPYKIPKPADHKQVFLIPSRLRQQIIIRRIFRNKS
ncbi:MATE family efflux transporter [Alkalitalea saponilacus]|uniref:Multidrug-efflux transporter n=1 Tax=Alkalitalea saponilacus TaxID=889453 RepID=A0A1T5G437_9BACT|nr:MATE family efflux transporter [Alkalitalea saponilacus]ASB47850.1 MATE family efflux transporter [Alkalitalea saponilacus]SKC03235.1 putative efflux protein, MATE family [Alkalitalea saponilacus]